MKRKIFNAEKIGSVESVIVVDGSHDLVVNFDYCSELIENIPKKIEFYNEHPDKPHNHRVKSSKYKSFPN